MSTLSAMRDFRPSLKSVSVPVLAASILSLAGCGSNDNETAPATTQAVSGVQTAPLNSTPPTANEPVETTPSGDSDAGEGGKQAAVKVFRTFFKVIGDSYEAETAQDRKDSSAACRLLSDRFEKEYLDEAFLLQGTNGDSRTNPDDPYESCESIVGANIIDNTAKLTDARFETRNAEAKLPAWNLFFAETSAVDTADCGTEVRVTKQADGWKLDGLSYPTIDQNTGECEPPFLLVE